MMKRFILFSILMISLFHSQISVAQENGMNKRFRIAVFTPLYLDSAFDATEEYRYGKDFPKFINSGLEFYEGIEMAADTLSKMGYPIDIEVMDTRSPAGSVTAKIASPGFEDFDMVIGHVNGTEARQLANAASMNKIPFINVNYPNDAGVTNNPFYVILNSTLNTQLQALYKLLQRNFALADLVYIRTKSTSDERLLSAFKSIEKNTSGVPVKFRYLTLDPSRMWQDLVKNLDSNRNNVFVVGSLDVNFSNRLVETINELGESYHTTLLGMPTWDNIKLEKTYHDNLEVVYGTPFYLDKEDSLYNRIHEEFSDRFYSRPSDMVYRGYETLLHFGQLLQLHGSNIASAIPEKKFRVFTDFDIQPVLDSKTMTLNYFENRKIYFIRRTGTEFKGIY